MGQLEFQLAYYNVKVQHISYSAAENSFKQDIMLGTIIAPSVRSVYGLRPKSSSVEDVIDQWDSNIGTPMKDVYRPQEELY